MKKTRFISGMAACLVITTGLAQNTRKPVFVSPEQFDITSILPNPPANDSAQTARELAELHKIQDTRSPSQIAHAQKDDVEEDMFIFHDVLGEKFTPAALPLAKGLSDHVKNDAGLFATSGKNYFKRPRPYHLDATIKPVCKTNDNQQDYSYPSGHGTVGYLEGLVLSVMVPEKRDAILKRADDYGHSRLVCGVHYAADEEASRATAYAVIGLLMNNPQFKKELDAAKAETRAALGF